MQHEALYLCHDLISLFAAWKEAWYELEAAPLSAAPFSLYLVSFRKKNDSFLERGGGLLHLISLLPLRNHFCVGHSVKKAVFGIFMSHSVARPTAMSSDWFYLGKWTVLTLIQSVIRGVVVRFRGGVKDLHLQPRLSFGAIQHLV